MGRESHSFGADGKRDALSECGSFLGHKKTTHICALQTEKLHLAVYAAGIPGEAAAGAYHSVAGNEQGNGVVTHRAAHGLGGRICADGGCTVPGDIAKAFGGGADWVMLGGMLAGHDEAGGETVEENGKVFSASTG